MNPNPVTHPPMTNEEIAEIAAKHRSPAAKKLLREVERLRVLELGAMSLARVIRAGRVDPSSLMPYVMGIEAENRGVLPGPGKFGIRSDGQESIW